MEWGRRKFGKKEQAYEEEKYSAARRRMLSIPFVDEDDYIPLGDIVARYSTSKEITPALSPEEPVDSHIMEDEHLDTILETKSDEFIKSSVEPCPTTQTDSIFDEFSFPRLPEESNSEYSNATIESLSPSPIPVEDSDPFMEEIDIFLSFR
ncbi:hypothetical protein Tco_1316379 [Tanacetum coccineum]